VISGTVADPANVKVPAAEVVLRANDRGEVGRRLTASDGNFFFLGLLPGEYSLEVTKAGYRSLEVRDLRVHVNDRRSLQFELRPSDGTPGTDTFRGDLQGVSSDTSTETAFELPYNQDLPLEPRTPASQVLTAPGVISVTESGAADAFGLPARMSYVTLDGISVGTGAQLDGSGFGPPGPTSLEALEEVNVRTTPIAPVSGETPGAQISMGSRAGTNLLHGSLYEYLRNEKWNANDWFANRAGLSRGKMRGNNFGVTVGGPLIVDRTFFFGSYEGLRLTQPRTSHTAVPTVAARFDAASDLQPYLFAFPLPNGPALSAGAAELTTVVTDQSNSDIAGLRLDHRLSDRISLFASFRYGNRDTSGRGYAGLTPNVITNHDSTNRSGTFALDWTPSPTTINEFRANVGSSVLESSSVMDNYFGAIPLTDQQVFPGAITSWTGSFKLRLGGASGYTFGGRDRMEQEQLQVRDTLAFQRGNHRFSFGVDYLRLAPTLYSVEYSVSPYFNGINGSTGSLLSGGATNTIVASGGDIAYPLYQHFSLNFEHSWRGTNRSTMTWGVRWEVNPPPDVRRGAPPFAQGGQGPTQVDALYGTRWIDIAPRVGFAYQLDTTPGYEKVFRIGVGLFHDDGTSHYIDPFSGAPYYGVKTLTAPSFPLDEDTLAPVDLPERRPIGRFNTTVLKLPTPEIFEWNIAVENKLGQGTSFSAAYVGTRGRDLPQADVSRAIIKPDDAEIADYDVLHIVFNGGRSDYHGIQLALSSRLRPNLHTQVSYTYGHAIDNDPYNIVEPGFATFGFSQLDNPTIDTGRASSDFDVRHTLRFAGSFSPPAPESGIAGKVFGDWWIDWMGTAHTSMPVKVEGVTMFSSDQQDFDEPAYGLYGLARPHTTGQAIWLDDPSAPGGRRLNRAAFALSEDFENGVLGRNIIRGFSRFQMNVAVRRRIAITERFRVDVAGQAYNVFNSPSFADPTAAGTANLASPNFGVATDTLNQSGGQGGSSRYRMGGPRSLEFSLRLVF